MSATIFSGQSQVHLSMRPKHFRRSRGLLSATRNHFKESKVHLSATEKYPKRPRGLLSATKNKKNAHIQTVYEQGRYVKKLFFPFNLVKKRLVERDDVVVRVSER